MKKSSILLGLSYSPPSPPDFKRVTVSGLGKWLSAPASKSGNKAEKKPALWHAYCPKCEYETMSPICAPTHAEALQNAKIFHRGCGNQDLLVIRTDS